MIALTKGKMTPEKEGRMERVKKNMNPVNGLEDEWSEGKKTEKKM